MTVRGAWTIALALVACDETSSASQESSRFVIPTIAFCEPVRSWPDDLQRRELELLEIINEYRQAGSECGDIRFPPSDPLRASGRAACAARVHASDMAANDFVGHIGSDESSPWDRLRSAGSNFAVADQTIAAGSLSPRQLVEDLWLPRQGSCAALLAPEYVQVGIGWATGADVTHEDYVVVTPERSRSLPWSPAP